ncbi:hypothetical protein [Arthrobacter sp. TMN-50]
MTGDHPGAPSPEEPSPQDIFDEQATDDDGPAFPPGTGGTGDPSVDGLTSRMASIPELPIDAHNTLYTGLHDGLLAELNADPSADHDAS